MVVTFIDAAAADGSTAGEPGIRSLAAFGGDIGGTGCGALDGNLVASGSIVVWFSLCTATNARSTSTTLCIFDGDIALNGHITKGTNTSANAGTLFASGGVIDFGVIFNSYIAVSKKATADASAITFTFSIFNNGAAGNFDITIAVVTTANARAVIITLCIFDDGIALNDYITISAKARAVWIINSRTTTNASGIIATSCSDLTASNFYIAIAAVTAADTGTPTVTRCGNCAAGNCYITVTAIDLAVRVSAGFSTADTSTTICAGCSNSSAGNSYLTIICISAANTGSTFSI